MSMRDSYGGHYPFIHRRDKRDAFENVSPVETFVIVDHVGIGFSAIT